MHLLFAARIPKRGEPEETCEDRFAVAGEPVLCAAVSDGASSGIFAGEWAQILAEGFVRHAMTGEAELPSLDPFREEWQRQTGSTLLPWYMQAKRTEGAAAALVGVTFDNAKMRWSVVAVGDCCLFQWRDGVLLTAFPVQRPGDFDSTPPLLHTDPTRSGEHLIRQDTGTYADGDEFLLMSDALAAWFLNEIERGRDPMVWLAKLATAKDFSDRITTLRDSNRLRNDDVALIHLRAETT
ncbi:MAG: hypothetical protein OHK0029_35410 [Armatimonadaceae bacterium]